MTRAGKAALQTSRGAAEDEGDRKRTVQAKAQQRQGSVMTREEAGKLTVVLSRVIARRAKTLGSLVALSRRRIFGISGQAKLIRAAMRSSIRLVLTVGVSVIVWRLAVFRGCLAQRASQSTQCERQAGRVTRGASGRCKRCAARALIMTTIGAGHGAGGSRNGIPLGCTVHHTMFLTVVLSPAHLFFPVACVSTFFFFFLLFVPLCWFFSSVLFRRGFSSPTRTGRRGCLSPGSE